MSNRSILKRITISGFKSISGNEALQSVDFLDTTIIIGANGAGKSNLISFFKMLNNMMTGAFQNFVGRNGYANNLLYFGSKKTPRLKAALEFQNSTDTDVYEFSLERTTQDELVFTEESITWNGKKTILGKGHRESVLSTSNQKKTYEQVVKTILSKCRAYQFHDTSESAHIKNYASIENNRYLMSDAGNIAAYLYMLKNTPDYASYYQRIVDKIRFVLPQFDDFVLKPGMRNSSTIRLCYRTKDDPDYIFGAEQISDGSLRFIALATLLMQPPQLLPNVIILDEPELGLHPQAINILSTLIKNASRNSQVILATQSPQILNNFSADDVVVAEYDVWQKASVFKRLCKDELDIWLEEYSLSQLWEQNVIGGQP